MKRLSILLVAFVALAALLGSCGGGGEEEVATLAVAFRLDEGSPVMVAYIGDPAEDPWQLPAGRYYIEALDQDDVLLSLGAVDVEDGDVVEFPPSFEAAGGVADPEEAEPLITLASLLIDLELAKYKFLEMVTGGFSETPFDPSVEFDEADFQDLAAMYEEIAAQGDSVLAALDKIEGRAEVSLRIPYVRSLWAPAEDLKRVRKQVLGLFVSVAFLVGEDPDWQIDLGEVIIHTAEGYGADVDAERKTPQNSEGLLDKKRKWEEYAKTVGADLPGLQKKISDDLKKLFPGLTSEQLNDWTKDYVNEIKEGLGKPSAPPTSPTKPMGVVSAYWQAMGCSESEVQEPLDDLSKCISSSAGSSFSQIVAQCSIAEYQPECVSEEAGGAAPEEAAEPAPAEPSEPEAEEAAQPEPEEAEEAEEAEEGEEPEPEEAEEAEEAEPGENTPEGVEVTAVGWFVGPLPQGWERVTNSITLRFNTAGGPGSVSGDSERVDRKVDPTDWTVETQHIQFSGSYSPDTRQLSGTVHVTGTNVDYQEGQILSEYPLDYPAVWSATWDGATVTGSVDGMGPFELTVQG
jgi:hypothetical protein